MRLLSAIKGRIERLYRADLGCDEDFIGRSLKEQALLDELKGHPGFSVLLDKLDGDVRAYIRRFFDAETPKEALALWREGKAFFKLTTSIEGGVLARTRGKVHEEYVRRQTELLKVDQSRVSTLGRAASQAARDGVYARTP